VFWLTFYLTPPMMDWIETGVGWLADYAATGFATVSLDELLARLV